MRSQSKEKKKDIITDQGWGNSEGKIDKVKDLEDIQ